MQKLLSLAREDVHHTVSHGAVDALPAVLSVLSTTEMLDPAVVSPSFEMVRRTTSPEPMSREPVARDAN